ncbi:MAG TPA: malonate decarboxylase subunit epsilon [Candidatus Sulfotelmatobacter sp.]|jgi:[acyl-carrier-protein] S-malonyltransferase|nr:malonate decarboxylase subunit epsilon [Candidatus Sulfotelmatobacter sp.]
MTLGILCPGQGDQTPGMFDILADSPDAVRILDLASARLGEDLRRLDADRLTVNAVAQPALCAFQLAAWAALSPHLSDLSAFAGYSVGELAAYGCAGVLSPEQILDLASTRARLMDAASPSPGGLMAVRGLFQAELSTLCTPFGAEIAIVNDIDRLVVGGPVSALTALEPILLGRGAKVTPLKITIASHTSLMTDAVLPFRDALEQSAWKRFSTPVLAGIDGSPVHERTRAVDCLSRQLFCPVLWSSCLEGLAEMGCRALLELGPGSGLARMARDRFPDLPVRALPEFRSLDGLRHWVEHL